MLVGAHIDVHVEISISRGGFYFWCMHAWVALEYSVHMCVKAGLQITIDQTNKVAPELRAKCFYFGLFTSYQYRVHKDIQSSGTDGHATGNAMHMPDFTSSQRNGHATVIGLVASGKDVGNTRRIVLCAG
jgi:hypothetical protein